MKEILKRIVCFLFLIAMGILSVIFSNGDLTALFLLLPFALAALTLGFDEEK